MTSEDFVSREDKCIWALVLIGLNIFGALLFYFIIVRESQTRADDGTVFNEEFYKNMIGKYPEHADLLNRSLEAPRYRRKNIEKYFLAFSHKKLVGKYNTSNTFLTAKSTGVLLAVLEHNKLLPLE